MGANSVKGLVLMETIFPSADNSTVFDDPKLKAKLQKEMKKGNVRIPQVGDEVDVDEDLDSKLDKSVAECWSYYDNKSKGSINKKQIQQFFKDCFELYALRKRMKPKECMAPGVNSKQALETCTRMMDKSGTGMVNQGAFVEFINECSLEEVIGPFINQNTFDISSRLPQNMMFDPSTLPKNTDKPQANQIQYRDYNQSL
ncbi:EF-hand domain-containing protein [Balamuthia mandrillaris]